MKSGRSESSSCRVSRITLCHDMLTYPQREGSDSESVTLSSSPSVGPVSRAQLLRTLPADPEVCPARLDHDASNRIIIGSGSESCCLGTVTGAVLQVGNVSSLAPAPAKSLPPFGVGPGSLKLPVNESAPEGACGPGCQPRGPLAASSSGAGAGVGAGNDHWHRVGHTTATGSANGSTKAVQFLVSLDVSFLALALCSDVDSE